MDGPHVRDDRIDVVLGDHAEDPFRHLDRRMHHRAVETRDLQIAEILLDQFRLVPHVLAGEQQDAERSSRRTSSATREAVPGPKITRTG
nr:hypothetical protein [Rhodococcus rhodochrous]